VYVDGSRPHLIEGFTRRTFIDMVAGVRDQAIATRMMSEKDWERGMEGLYRTTASDGAFCYTFFKGIAHK
jgi:hypothetical protein